jgi:hypothetical protein
MEIAQLIQKLKKFPGFTEVYVLAESENLSDNATFFTPNFTILEKKDGIYLDGDLDDLLHKR